jgi:hypothetical protein
VRRWRRSEGWAAEQRGRLVLVLTIVILVVTPGALAAQTTGTIAGRVTDAASDLPLATAQVAIEGLGRSTTTDDDGRFVLGGVPTGSYSLRIELLSYRPLTLEGVEVRAGRRTSLEAPLNAAAIEMEPIVVKAERIPLIEPEVSESHHVTLGRQLRELPTDNTEAAIELTPGVTDGHFRGGRIGQETYVVDGFGVKNQLEGSSQGFGLEFSPYALEEIDVTTGGFGVEYGAALSGVVNLRSRRGDPERWHGRLNVLGDHWAPDDYSRGFSELAASAGGPLPFLGPGTTLFADILFQGLLDADPRSQGLTCLDPADAEPELAAAIDSLRADPTTANLYCPFESDMFPNQEGDKFIGFLRLDFPVGQSSNFMASLLRNRLQRQLYTQDFKYNPTYQLGQRLTGTLGTLAFDWAKDTQGRAYHVTARAAALRLDRYLGVVDPEALAGRSTIAGFGISDFEFLGEEFARLPIGEQQNAGNAVPGYSEPGGSTGSPFGPAAEGIFFTEGTPGIANWSRYDLIGADLVGELLAAAGHSFKAGLSGRYHTVESYERAFAYAPDSIVNFNSYNPITLNGFAEARIATSQLFAATVGVRLEAFRSGLSIPIDTTNSAAPTIDSDWKTVFTPRVGFAGAFRNSAGQTAFHFNYSRVAQPPDFRYFADTTIGDSLRTDIRRQGNPNLGFEEGRAYELGVSHVWRDAIGLSLTAFRKELIKLVTGSLSVSRIAPGQFSTGDRGTIKGVELTAYGRWPGIEFRVGYTLQEATGLTSGALDEDVDPDASVLEFPLAFDRRHSLDVIVLAGRSAAYTGTGWGGSLVVSARSGFPLDRHDDLITRLPWTYALAIRVTRDLGGFPFCDGCRTRAVLDGRNITGRDNVIALRRDTGGLGPPPADVAAVVDDIPSDMQPIPRESSRYNPLTDLDRNELITADEMRRVRYAAELDRNDPSLFFGAARQLRLGLEVTF